MIFFFKYRTIMLLYWLNFEVVSVNSRGFYQRGLFTTSTVNQWYFPRKSLSNYLKCFMCFDRIAKVQVYKLPPKTYVFILNCSHNIG